MKMVATALVATLISGFSPGALPLPAAASHYHQERLPNGVIYEPIGPNADDGSRMKFLWSGN
jgi:hypothetical protein